MKRYFWLISFLLLTIAWPVNAQNKASSEAYQDFLNSYRHYQGLIEPFNTKKNRHLTYQSVSTQAELLQVTKDLITAEIEAMIAYTSFIRSYLAEATQILAYRENFLYVKLDDEIAFLNLSLEKSKSLSSLTEAQQLLGDISNHFKKITQMNYEIKSLVEIESTKKIYQNLKVEEEKIGTFLLSDKADQIKVMAAKEKFTNLEKEMEKTENLLKTAQDYQKNFESDDPKETSVKIRETLDEALVKMKQILSGYKNIIFSLK